MASMSHLAQNEIQSDQRSGRPESTASHRRRPLRLLFVTTAMGSESIGQLTAHGAFDYVELEHLPQLPMTVRRVLKEKKLRDELREAKKALRHSQSLYRALTDNPAYGVYRCNAEGE